MTQPPDRRDPAADWVRRPIQWSRMPTGAIRVDTLPPPPAPTPDELAIPARPARPARPSILSGSVLPQAAPRPAPAPAAPTPVAEPTRVPPQPEPTPSPTFTPPPPRETPAVPSETAPAPETGSATATPFARRSEARSRPRLWLVGGAAALALAAGGLWLALRPSAPPPVAAPVSATEAPAVVPEPEPATASEADWTIDAPAQRAPQPVPALRAPAVERRLETRTPVAAPPGVRPPASVTLPETSAGIAAPEPEAAPVIIAPPAATETPPAPIILGPPPTPARPPSTDPDAPMMTQPQRLEPQPAADASGT